jgi:GTPase
MNLPIITIFTKIDLINETKRIDLVKHFRELVSRLKLSRVPLIMKSNDDIVLFSRNIEEKNLMPTFLVGAKKIYKFFLGVKCPVGWIKPF